MDYENGVLLLNLIADFWDLKEQYDKTQEHILNCNVLVDQNNLFTYIPTHSDLYSEGLEEKLHIFKKLWEREKNTIKNKHFNMWTLWAFLL